MQIASIAALFLLLLVLAAPQPARSEDEGWLAASRRVNRQSQIWVAPAGGGAWQRLTTTPGDKRWPAWHPEGHSLAYAARRDRNWDLYVLDLRTGEERRLTTNAHFDGWPSWSPDGRRIAFASSREGDLDIYMVDLRSGRQTNLTPQSLAQDFEPRWEDENHILFVSTRDRSHSIFRLNVQSGTTVPLSTSEQRNERLPLQAGSARSPNHILVVAKEGRESNLTWLRERSDSAPLSWTGAVTSAAIAPDGSAVAWLERRLEGDILYRRSLDGGDVQVLNGPTPRLDELHWGRPDPALLHSRLQPLALDRPVLTVDLARNELVRIDNLETVQPRISARAEPSFTALRARLLDEIGFDFLGTISEALRPVDFASAESDYLSWHKTGRAIDTLFELGWRGQYKMLEVVREDWHGDVYWRLWLRCRVQDGTCGEPLVDAAWDYTYDARWTRAPGEGGHPKPFQTGYYVDFTTLAEDEGWYRIASYEAPDFDWRTNTVGMEYWHYQITHGLTWYESAQEVYSPATIEQWFGWEQMVEHEIPRWLLKAKGVPLPPEVRHAPAEMIIP